MDEVQADLSPKNLLELNLVMLDTRVVTCDEGATVGIQLHYLVLEYCGKEVSLVRAKEFACESIGWLCCSSRSELDVR